MEPKEQPKTRGSIKDTPCPANMTGKHSWRSISSLGTWAEQECRFCKGRRETILPKPIKRGRREHQKQWGP